MIKRVSWAPALLALSLQAAAEPPTVVKYRGLCEASAAAFLDRTRFAVASDESNAILIYERGNPEPLNGRGYVSEHFTGFDKSDIEGAAAIGARIFWISSHSLNKDREDKPKRKILFATTPIAEPDGGVSLVGIGKPHLDLRDAIAAAILPLTAMTNLQEVRGALDIEGVAAGPEGELLIGLRAPLGKDNTAIVVPLLNPVTVVENGSAPELGVPTGLVLLEQGIRSLERIGSGDRQYLVAAGRSARGDGEDPFSLHWWAGPGFEPVKIDAMNFEGVPPPTFKPEVLIAVPGQPSVQILSDDGRDSGCQDGDLPLPAATFRSLDWTP